MRILVLGLDGASLRLIRPWVEQGELPTFARIMEEGAWGDLESVPNQRSAAAWGSFMTGKNPGKHGIYEFYEYLPDRYNIRFVNGRSRRGDTFWHLAGEAGRKVGVVNVPMTYPAERVNGFLIAGLDAPGVDSKGFTYPPGLYEELVNHVGGYTIEPGLTGCIVAGDVDLAVKLLHQELDERIAANRHLMARHPWDLLVTVFRSTDAAHHCFWKYTDPGHPEYRHEDALRYGGVILSAYRKADDFLKEVIQEYGEEILLLVVSDHGCGRKHPASNQLNQWLESKGYLRYLGRGEAERRSLLLGWIYRLVIARTPRRLKENLWRWFPRLRNHLQSRLCFAGIDWKRTRAFSDSLFPIVQVNLRGREAMGIVEGGEEYRNLVKELKDGLARLEDSKSGERIVDAVFHREEIYSGPYVEKAPDILIRFREDVTISGLRVEGKDDRGSPIRTPLIPGEDYRVISGDHNLNGVLIAWGKGVARRPNIRGARLVDIAPTILYAMSIAVPGDMDGVELVDLFDERFVSARRTVRRKVAAADAAVEVESGYSNQEEDQLRERLRGLGYIE